MDIIPSGHCALLVMISELSRLVKLMPDLPFSLSICLVLLAEEEEAYALLVRYSLVYYVYSFL